MAMKLAELGQLVAKAQDWVMPKMAGKARAVTHPAVVRVRERPGGAAVMNALTA